MWSTADYHLIGAGLTGNLPLTIIEWIFEQVWRFDFAAPGFCVLDLGSEIDSHGLRSTMLDLKAGLSDVGDRRFGIRFAYRSLGRFDQQVTTKFHLDGAPNQSLLMLGYEPSPVPSRLAMADYSRCAHDLGIEPQRFLDTYNPMYRRGEALLDRYLTVLPRSAEDQSRIVLINNSSLPFSADQQNPLGVLHQAEIPVPDASKQRVINSIMLRVDAAEPIDGDLLQQFVTTRAISGKILDQE